MSYDLYTTERCLLSRVLIEAGDNVVRVLVWRRDIDPNLEGDYFRDTDHFRDVLDIQVGRYDGEDGLVDQKNPSNVNKCWHLYFHLAAWQLAQSFHEHLAETFYDPPAKARREVMELHAEYQKKTRKKIRLAPEFHDPKFPIGIKEFAKVVMFAWQTGAQLIPPIDGIGDADAKDYMAPALACASLAAMLWQRKLADPYNMLEDVTVPYEPTDIPPENVVAGDMEDLPIEEILKQNPQVQEIVP